MSDHRREARNRSLFDSDLDAGRLPDIASLSAHFRPAATPVLKVSVELVPLGDYDELATVPAVAANSNAEAAA